MDLYHVIEIILEPWGRAAVSLHLSLDRPNNMDTLTGDVQPLSHRRPNDCLPYMVELPQRQSIALPQKPPPQAG
jgi:hypothetical protein